MQSRVAKNDPLHPAFLIRSLLEETHVTITAAEALVVSHQQLHALIARRAAVSAKMAIRLETSLGSTTDLWMRLQQRYDLARMCNLGPSARKIVAPQKLTEMKTGVKLKAVTSMPVAAPMQWPGPSEPAT